MKTTPVRWWNLGRYEDECAAFDAQHPLARELWSWLRRTWSEQLMLLARQPLIRHTVSEGTGPEIRIRPRLDIPMQVRIAYTA